MPLYEYECQACGERVEVIQKFSDPHKTRCPKCKGRLRRLLSAPGIHFKGSGWYITDYARKSSTASTDSAPEGGSASDGKSGESKPPAGGAASAAPPARRSTRRRAPARRGRR